MAEGYPDRAAPSPLLSELVGAGRLGRKSGAGFRSYGPAGSRQAPDPAVASILGRHRLVRDPSGSGALADRLFLPMLLEAVRVLEEGIVADPSDVDLGVILGFGFPAARGGILRWCDAEGAASILERLEKLEALGPCVPPHRHRSVGWHSGRRPFTGRGGRTPPPAKARGRSREPSSSTSPAPFEGPPFFYSE